jgi:hypothetical protein
MSPSDEEEEEEETEDLMGEFQPSPPHSPAPGEADVRPYWPQDLLTTGELLDEGTEESLLDLALETFSELAREARPGITATPASPREEESDSSIEILAVVSGFKTEPAMKEEVEEAREAPLPSTSARRRKGIPRKRPLPQEDD